MKPHPLRDLLLMLSDRWPLRGFSVCIFTDRRPVKVIGGWRAYCRQVWWTFCWWVGAGGR